MQQRPFYVEQALPVRGYDIDFAQIVSNIVYVRWLEDLRTRILDEYFPLDYQFTQGIVPVLLSTTIEYKRAITMFDKPIGHMWISALGKVRWTIQAEIRVAETIVAQATQTGVFVKLDSKRPIPMPVELVDQYRNWPTGDGMINDER